MSEDADATDDNRGLEDIEWELVREGTYDGPMDPSDKIYIAGHRGMVGSAIKRRLEAAGYDNFVTRTSDDLDLTRQAGTEAFFEDEQPDYVFLAAAKVGGIVANRDYPADFIRDNLQIQNNVITAAHQTGVEKLCFLGSSCIYPKHAPQPMKEEHLLTGELESTNQWYAVAKIAGIKMCQAYRRQHGFDAIALQPTNLYGPRDNFHPEHSHVMAALIRKFHEAAANDEDEVVVWGTGEPRREFLHVDDLADAAYYLMQNYNEEEIVNVGVGEDTSVQELAQRIKKITGFQGEIVNDLDKPDGTPRKLLDVSRLQGAGWTADIPLDVGIRSALQWYRAQ
jgi:GDP-L-fucose synthase